MFSPLLPAHLLKTSQLFGGRGGLATAKKAPEWRKWRGRMQGVWNSTGGFGPLPEAGLRAEHFD